MKKKMKRLGIFIVMQVISVNSKTIAYHILLSSVMMIVVQGFLYNVLLSKLKRYYNDGISMKILFIIPLTMTHGKIISL